MEDRADVPRKIAGDLFNYLKSFDEVGERKGYMTVPNDVFDRWLRRFEHRFKMDPNFFMKGD